MKKIIEDPNKAIAWRMEDSGIFRDDTSAETFKYAIEALEKQKFLLEQDIAYYRRKKRRGVNLSADYKRTRVVKFTAQHTQCVQAIVVLKRQTNRSVSMRFHGTTHNVHRYTERFKSEPTEIFAEYFESKSVRAAKAHLAKIANGRALISYLQSWDNETRGVYRQRPALATLGPSTRIYPRRWEGHML